MKPFFQSEAFCGPASLKIALSYLGKEFSEAQLARWSGATRANGTEHEGMIAAVKKARMNVFAKERGTLAEIEKLTRQNRLPVIVGWFETDGDHYSVVNHVSKEFVYLMDPATKSGRRKISKKKFISVWYDFEGETNSRTVKCWYMVVSP